MQKKALAQTQLQAFLQQLESGSSDYLTIYTTPSSFPAYAIGVAVGHGSVGDELRAVLTSEQILREARSRGTGAVVFWGDTENRYLILPPFAVCQDISFRGKPNTSALKEMLQTKRLLGLVLVTWGSYALGIIEGDKLLDYKTGTGYIHKKHRKGGRSQKRFARRTEEQKKDFLRRVANHIDEKFGQYRLEQIFLGGNRLIAKPLFEECRYLNSHADETSRRTLSVRHADREALVESVQDIYSSPVYHF